MSNVFSHLSCAALTDQGRKRKNNEDAYAAFPESGVFCVADGMGGAEDGEVASQAVVEGLASRLGELATQGCPIEGRSVQARIARTLNEVSSWIYARSEERGTRGTGTTFVGVCFDPAHPETATALHAGDSRLYLLRKRLFTQITRDHSAAALAGVKDEKDLNPMFRGIVMRAVGVNETVEVERTPFGIAEGDQILLCSDGLTRMVGDKEINKILRKAKTPEAAARELVDRANRNGGVDNVTVIVIRVGALPPAAACLTLAPEGERSAQETQDERVTRDATPAEEDTGATRNFAQGAATPSTPGSGDLLPFELATPTPTPTPDVRTPETVPEKKEAPGPVKPKKKRRRSAFMAGGAVLLLVCGGLWMGRRDTGVDPLASDVPERKPARGSDAVEDHAVRNEAARKVVEAERTATREAEEARRTEERRRAGEAARVAAAAEAARKAEEARRTEERRKAEEAARVAAAAEAARKAEEARRTEERRKAEEAARVAAAAEAARKAAAEQFGSEADRLLIRLAKDREALERFAAVANSFDSEDAKRTARAVMESAKQVAPFEGRRKAAGCDAALNTFIGELANAAGFMETYLEYEWRPRLSLLTDPHQTREAERLIGQFEKLIKRRGGLGRLSEDAVRLELHELVRLTAECVRQWRNVPGLVPSGR